MTSPGRREPWQACERYGCQHDVTTDHEGGSGRCVRAGCRCEAALVLARIARVVAEQMAAAAPAVNAGDDLKQAIATAVSERMRFIAANRERLIEAWVAETGCLPSESELVEQRFGDEVRVSVRRRAAATDGVRAAVGHGTPAEVASAYSVSGPRLYPIGVTPDGSVIFQSRPPAGAEKHPPPWRWVLFDGHHEKIIDPIPEGYSPSDLVDANGLSVIRAEGSEDAWVEFASPRVRALTELAAEMERELRALEWRGTYPTDTGDSCCPRCDADASKGRHSPDCALAGLLARIPKEGT